MPRNLVAAAVSGFCFAALSGCGGGEDDGNAFNLQVFPTYFAWMNAEIQSAWAEGFFGQGSRLVVVDDFEGDLMLEGNLGLGTEIKSHGDWISQHVEIMSPGAEITRLDFADTDAITLSSGKLNIVNLSYVMIGNFVLNADINWSLREASIISHADGAAVVVKAAGNDQIAVGNASGGQIDYLSRDLIGKPTAIFVGAMNSHGTVENPASLANYSNFAGTDLRVQEQFIVVGVTGGTLANDGTNLYGTSFAAPQVSAYAAIIGSKFTTATPLQITDQLLDTARTDTIQGYDLAIHGQGEASLSRALAPQSIN